MKNESNKKKQLCDNTINAEILQGIQDQINSKNTDSNNFSGIGNLLSWIDKNKSIVHHASFVETKNIIINLRFYVECISRDLQKIIDTMNIVEKFEQKKENETS